MNAERRDGQISTAARIEPQEQDVCADHDLFEPVLLNVLRNAWYSTHDIEHLSVQRHGRLNRRRSVVVEV